MTLPTPRATTTPEATRSNDSLPVLGVVLVNFASSDLIERNLGVVALHHCHVIVVDNWSGAAERQRIAEVSAGRGWTLVAMESNGGFGPGVNAGAVAARALGCTSILLLNPDVVVTPATVEALREQSVREPWQIISPRLVDLEGRVVFEGSSLDLVDGRNRNAAKASADPVPGSRPVVWLTAACLAVHLDLWEQVQGFDETYFMYWEDVDFNFRCLAAGAEVVLRPDLVAVHDQGGTQGPRRGRAKSGLYYYYNCRNRMLFALRNLRDDDVLRWAWRTPRVSYEIWLHGGRRQVLHSPGLVVHAIRGAAAGMAAAARQLTVQWWSTRVWGGRGAPSPDHQHHGHQQFEQPQAAVPRGEEDVPERQATQEQGQR